MKSMNRKKFIKSSLAAAVLGVTGTSAFLEGCSKSEQPSPAPSVHFTLDLSLPKNGALNHSGGSVVSHNVIVINVNGSYKALSVICTHQGCSVAYNQNNEDLVCPCHGGVYNLNGDVLAGPPPSPLKKYSVTQSGHILTIKG